MHFLFFFINLNWVYRVSNVLSTSSFRTSLSLTALSVKFSPRNVSISKWDARFKVKRVHTNSHRSGSAVLVSGEICFRLTASNHMGRLKKKFNYKFNSSTVTANCTWRRSCDFHRSIIAPWVDCNSDDRSFIVSRSSWRQKSSSADQQTQERRIRSRGCSLCNYTYSRSFHSRVKKPDRRYFAICVERNRTIFLYYIFYCIHLFIFVTNFRNKSKSHIRECQEQRVLKKKQSIRGKSFAPRKSQVNLPFEQSTSNSVCLDWLTVETQVYLPKSTVEQIVYELFSHWIRTKLLSIAPMFN